MCALGCEQNIANCAVHVSDQLEFLSVLFLVMNQYIAVRRSISVHKKISYSAATSHSIHKYLKKNYPTLYTNTS